MQEEQGGSEQRLCIVAVTAGALSHEMDSCAAAGMDHFLPKPIRPKDVETLLRAQARRRDGCGQPSDWQGVVVALGPGFQGGRQPGGAWKG